MPREDAIWPMPKFNFLVNWGDSALEIRFQEVTGLDTETEIIEYRHADSKEFYPVKMPGIGKVGNVSLKRGVFPKGQDYWNWINHVKLNSIARETVVIKLLNENGKATMEWTLSNAWPTKITSTDMENDGNEAAIDTLELAYETLTITNTNNP